MDSGNKILIIKEFETYKVYDSFASNELAKPYQIFSSSGIKEWIQRIDFCDSQLNQTIRMDLYGLKESTKVYSLNEKEFGDYNFQELCLLFKLNYKVQIKKHAYICVGNEERQVSIALKKSQDGMIYLVLFNIDSGDGRKDSTLCVFGVWKITANQFYDKKATPS